MPPARVDLDRLRPLGAALGPLGECAGDGADEVLEQFPDVGDRETQAVLDGWVEQAAGLLREIGATATELVGLLPVGSPASPTELSGPAELTDPAAVPRRGRS